MYHYWELETTDIDAIEPRGFVAPGYNRVTRRDIQVYYTRFYVNWSRHDEWFDYEGFW